MTTGCIWGRHPVAELLRGGSRRVDEVAVLSGAAGPLAEVVGLARRAGIKVSFRTRDQLTAIAGSAQHQGVVARVASAEYVDLDALLEVPLDRGEPAFFLALDQVQDPHNFGALLRTAAGLGIHGVIVPKHHAVGLTGVVAKAAMGAVDRVPVARETNMVAALTRLKKSGIWVYGGVPRGGGPPWRAALGGAICLVVGSEGEGLRPLVARTCDELLTIPMAGGGSSAGDDASLNVSVAGAILCYEVVRQRAAKGLDVGQSRP